MSGKSVTNSNGTITTAEIDNYKNCCRFAVIKKAGTYRITMHNVAQSSKRIGIKLVKFPSDTTYNSGTYPQGDNLREQMVYSGDNAVGCAASAVVKCSEGDALGVSMYYQAADTNTTQ